MELIVKMESVADYFASHLNVTLLPTHKFTSPAQAEKELQCTPIEELLFSQTALDTSAGTSTLTADLFIEIKSIRNVSKPFQRATDVMVDDEPKDVKIGPKKGQTYQLIAHDGVRFVKIVLLFNQQANFVGKLFETNKFFVKKGVFITRPDGTLTILIDFPEQLVEHSMDRKSPKLQESYFDIKGLPIKYTGAPRFKFLNDRSKGQSGEYVEQLEEEVEDENADLFKHFDVPDLSAHERCYISRFQQMGFWRKKF